MKRKESVKRKNARECLSQLRLACELVKLIRRLHLRSSPRRQSLLLPLPEIMLVLLVFRRIIPNLLHRCLSAQRYH